MMTEQRRQQGEWPLYRIKPITITVRGRQFERDVLEHPGSVCVLALFGSDSLVFVRQSRPAIGRESLELPGGRVRPGEKPEDAAVREMEAKTGMRPIGLRLLATFFPAPGYSSERTWCFVAEDLEPGRMEFDASEEMSVEFLSWPATRAAIEAGAIADARSLVALTFWGEEQRGGLIRPGKTF